MDSLKVKPSHQLSSLFDQDCRILALHTYTQEKNIDNK
jgi:hypothetical protein